MDYGREYQVERVLLSAEQRAIIHYVCAQAICQNDNRALTCNSRPGVIAMQASPGWWTAERQVKAVQELA